MSLSNHQLNLTNPGIHKNKKQLDGITVYSPNNTTDHLKKFWGEPDDIETLDSGLEIWTYDFGLRWNGVFLWVVIVPIPLAVPVGYQYIEFKAKDGFLVEGEVKQHRFKRHFFCGVIFLVDQGPVCG